MAHLEKSVEKSINNHYDFAIIGGGIAGVTCCEQLIAIYNEKQINKSIVLISVHPLLKAVSKLQKVSQYLMDVEVKEYSSQQFKDKYNTKNKYIKLSIIQGYVTNINHLQHSITYKTLSNQIFNISFNKCLIATGGSPKLFYINNKRHKLIHALRDSETVENFSKIIQSSQCHNICIVGNGGISMELVYTLLKHKNIDKNNKKLNIFWIIKHNHIGNTFLDQASAAFLIPTLFPKEDPKLNKSRLNNMNIYENIKSSSDKASVKHGGAVGPRWIGNLSKASKQIPLWLEHTEINNDVEMKNDENKENDDIFPNELILKMNCDISSIEECDNKLKVSLTNGEILIIDSLLCAMGVIPNTSFCDKKVFKMTENGEIFVNEYLETNINNIYCAGDCCHIELDDEDDNDSWFQMKLWSQSQRMGFIAAHSMSCNNDDEIENNIHLQFNFELFGHITKFFGKKCIFLGKYNMKKDEKKGIKILMRVKPNEEFIKLVIKNGRAVGAVLIGETELEETFENLILNKTDLTCYGDDFLKFNVDLEAMFD